jgi:hypothetical protein
MTTLDIAGLAEDLRDLLGTPTPIKEPHRERLSPTEQGVVLKAANTLERQAAEIARLREALHFYADRKRYRGNDTSRWTAVGDDEGRTARAALIGEDTATLSLSDKTQTRGDACTS